jgi:SNF2 family DNA or RNA helicase
VVPPAALASILAPLSSSSLAASMRQRVTDSLRDVRDAAQCSVKFSRLLEILEEIISEGGKAIIFTSYQQSIDLLVSEIASRTGIPSDSIDGRVPVPERQLKVDKFSAQPSSAVLVLNPKAAGTGLNITGALNMLMSRVMILPSSMPCE